MGTASSRGRYDLFRHWRVVEGGYSTVLQLPVGAPRVMRFLVEVPAGFSLRDSVCSYGFYMLAANRWVEAGGYFTRPLHVPNQTAAPRFAKLVEESVSDERLLSHLIRLAVHEIGRVHAEVHQEGATLLRVELVGREPGEGGGVEQRVLEAVVRAQVRRMLRLSDRELQAQRTFARQYCAATCSRGGRAKGSTVHSALAAEGAAAATEGAAVTPPPAAEGTSDEALPLGCPSCGPKAANRGRIFRSPTCWEDALRTITLCNMSWPGTRRMNWQLCQAFGGQMPLPSQLAVMDAARLQQECGVGYRAERMVALARAFLTEPPPPKAASQRGSSSEPPSSKTPPRPPAKRRLSSPSSSPPRAPPVAIDPEWLDSPQRSEAEVYEASLSWQGFGPYAAATLCQLLGHYGSIPADTETVRHLSEAHGIDTRAASATRRPQQQQQQQPGGKKRAGNGSPDRAKLCAVLERLYGGYGSVRFLAYWTELWEAYVAKVGVAHMAELAEERYGDFTATTMARLQQAQRQAKTKGGQGGQR